MQPSPRSTRAVEPGMKICTSVNLGMRNIFKVLLFIYEEILLSHTSGFKVWGLGCFCSGFFVWFWGFLVFVVFLIIF